MQAPHDTSPTQKTRTQEFSSALGEHVYRAELICYSLLLIAGVSQIVIRENFPKLNPPWPVIIIPLMIVLFGILLVPPFLLAIRVWKKPESSSGETQSE